MTSPYADTAPLTRRRLLSFAALGGGAAVLAGCATMGEGPGGGVPEALRRLLTIATGRAVARLASGNGYLDDALARVTLPPQMGDRTGAVLSALLRSGPVQDQLAMLVNRAAGAAADRAAPMLYDSIRRMSFADALSIARGGPTAATDYLERSTGDAIVDVMLPPVGAALHDFDGNGILGPVLGAATGIDIVGLQRTVAMQAARGLWRVIGREEAGIRADPASARDPLIMAVFGGGAMLR